VHNPPSVSAGDVLPSDAWYWPQKQSVFVLHRRDDLNTAIKTFINH
jgi:hypothetical protein